ncbi:receptor-interacting serine/threonine-protein kinase 2-like [Branchiostoma floridae x Branchiostoma japonicum]
MSKDYKKLKDTFMKIKEYQQKFMQEQQKVQVAELTAEERTREVQQLCQQVKDMQKVHQETLHKMDQQCRDQIDKPSVTVDDNFPVIEFGRLNFPAESYLGHGGFAAVVKGYHRDWKQDVAVKCLLHGKTEGSQQPLLYSEARKLNLGGRSTCIISLLGVCLDPNFAIVMPYMENGSLAGLLRDVDVPWALRWRMAHEISLGMTFLHCQNPQILHCDLKSENVLLDDDFHAKISDFGLSKWRTQSRIVTGTSPTGATITHAPPEFITDINLIPSTKFDVYSFGVLLWEIITRRKPYENAMNSALIKLAVRDGQRPDLRFVPTNVPDVGTVSQLMQRCWRQNPEDRPTFQECEDQLKDVRETFSKETFYAAIIYITATKVRPISK